MEVLLAGGDRTLRLRQGESVRRGDALLQFSHAAAPPKLRYDMVFKSKTTDKEQAFVLFPGAREGFGGWIIRCM